MNNAMKNTISHINWNRAGDYYSWFPTYRIKLLVYHNYYLVYLIFIAGNEAISHLQTLFIDTLTKAFTCDDGQTEREENG